MKKLAYFLAMAILILSVCGCADKDGVVKDSEKIPNPVEDPGGYVPGMADLNKKMQDDIQSATDKENKMLQKSLEDGN